jgi:hypothetical protein
VAELFYNRQSNYVQQYKDGFQETSYKQGTAALQHL